MNHTIDLAFPVQAISPLAADHSYHLYAGVSRLLPAAHAENGIGIHPIRGQQIGDRSLQLTARSRLAIRIAADQIPNWLTLAGKSIDIAGVKVRIGVPQVFALQPATALRSRLVTTKNCQDQARFETELRRQLDALNVSPEAIVTIGKRRTLRIKEKDIVGYEVIIEALTAEESLNIQTTGLGGRRHMGCGIFVALTSTEALRES